MKIFLVGCGNLGKRYAEGLAKITNLEEARKFCEEKIRKKR